MIKKGRTTIKKEQSKTTDALSQHTLSTTALGFVKHLLPWFRKQAFVARASIIQHVGVSISSTVFKAVGTELTAAVRIVLSPLGTLECETSSESNECARAARARQRQNTFDDVLAMATKSLLVVRHGSNGLHLVSG